MSKQQNKEHKLICACGRTTYYSNKYNLAKAIKKNSCRSCSKLGTNNPKYNKGYLQVGSNNPNYGNPKGYIHNSKTRDKISKSKKGTKRDDMIGDNNPAKRLLVRKKLSIKMKGDKNHRYGKKPWNYGLGTHKLSDFQKYKRLVWNITKKNIKNIPNFDEKKRGRAGDGDAFQVDHIVSIKDGFNNNIPPEEVGALENLQFIHWLDNIKKRDLNNLPKRDNK